MRGAPMLAMVALIGVAAQAATPSDTPASRANATRLEEMRARAAAAKNRVHAPVIVPTAQWQEEDPKRREAEEAKLAESLREKQQFEAALRAQRIADDRERREDRQRLNAALPGLFTNPMIPSSPTNSRGNGVSGSSTVTLSNGTTFTATADEVARFTAAEQANASSASGTGQPYQAAYDQLERDRAKSDVRRTEINTQVQASRDHEARSFAASPTANQGNTESAPKKSVTTSGGLIVRPSDTGYAQRVAGEEAERKRSIEAAKEQEVRDIAKWRAEQTEADRKAAEDQRLDAENKRRIEQCMQSLACRNKTAKARPM